MRTHFSAFKGLSSQQPFFVLLYLQRKISKCHLLALPCPSFYVTNLKPLIGFNVFYILFGILWTKSRNVLITLFLSVCPHIKSGEPQLFFVKFYVLGVLLNYGYTTVLVKAGRACVFTHISILIR